MVLVIAFLLMIVSESSDLAAEGAPPTHFRVRSSVTKFLERRSLLFENGCEADSFDFNIKPQLRFVANQKTTTRSKPEDELQCKNCEKSGVPPGINCSNSNTDSLKSAKWSCEGPFPDAVYKIASYEINCEYDDIFRQHCVKMGSCVLTITAGFAGTVDWLLFFFLTQVAVILIGVIIYKSKDRVRSMIAERRSRPRPDFRIDIVEARRRGREEIKRLRAERDLATATTTTTPATPKKESASEESYAMRAPTAAWLE